jgi:hypothetical protein
MSVVNELRTQSATEVSQSILEHAERGRSENNIHVDDATSNLRIIQIVFEEQISSRSDFS